MGQSQPKPQPQASLPSSRRWSWWHSSRGANEDEKRQPDETLAEELSSSTSSTASNDEQNENTVVNPGKFEDVNREARGNLMLLNGN